MKKLFSKSFLALVLAMTMLMGMSMNVMAASATYTTTDGYEDFDHTYYWFVEGPKIQPTPLKEGDILGAGLKQGNWGIVYINGRAVPSNYTLSQDCKIVEIFEAHIYLETCGSAPATSSHTHNYEWNTLVDPTTEQDGVEAYICSCGDIQATQPISAAHNILKSNADAVKNAKAGATVVVELGRLNSLPKWFVTKLVERDDLNVTLKITYNHQNYTLEIPKTATIEDESIEWYGPLKLLSMFPQK